MSSKQIRFQQPALNFHEALPIGSGRLGAMVYSGISSDRLSLNADTLWAGLEPPKPRENANKAFLEARELLFADKRHEAEALLESQVETDFVQPYLPAGDLIITMQEAEGAGDYSRSLTLDDALARSEFLIGDIRVQKESFASFPDDVIVLKWRASEGCLPALRFALNSPLRHECVADGDGLKLHGRLPVNVRWDVVDYEATPENYVTYSDASVRYCVDCRIVAHDGELAAQEGALGLENARYFVAHISIARADEDRKFRKLKANLNRLKAQSYEDLKARHVADYCALFEQFSLRIGENKSPEDSGAWIESAGDLPAKLQRGFDFGRYLLIASSRLGTMPANLQGIWNEEITPPWWSNYTININTQMNYWGAEMTGLSECHLPLFEFIRKLAENGENTAREQYGARGWVVHHQTDYLGQTTPVGYLPYDVISDSAKWAIWVMGGPWLSLHIIEHARYHNDTGVLKKYYSVLEGAAAFLCDWLIEDRNNPGFLTTAPSTSPENTYIFSDGASCALTTGSTMDIAITRQYFREMLWVMERLGISDALKAEIEAKLSRLPDTPYTDDGRILEFDADWPEGEAPHRHISHLFALTPGNSVDPIIDETYAKGALKALAYRGDTGTGWSLVWKARCYARLGMGEKAYQMLQALFSPVKSTVFEMGNDGGGIYPNFFMACPPFMIEANFGFIASLLELLVQVHEDEIKLLPALPEALASGEFNRLRLPNQIEMSMNWRDGKIAELSITSKISQTVTLRYNDVQFKIDLRENEEQSIYMSSFAEAEMGGV